MARDSKGYRLQGKYSAGLKVAPVEMMKLGTKLTLFNLLSKTVFAALFILLLPFIIERINILQTDNELIRKREEVLNLIAEIGIEPFITPESEKEFGSYNILKEEFISLEKTEPTEEWNFIEVTQRKIEDETIDYRVLNYSFQFEEVTYLLEIGKSLASISNTHKNIRKVILVFLLVFIAVTLLSDIFYTERILRPLKRVIRKLETTSTPSLFDTTPVKTSTSDFVQLDTTIRDLMAKIGELFEKEQEITVNISHELMTPISVIQSKLENLLLQKDIDIAVSGQIEESLRTLHRLKTLVNSLLFIARIESRQYLKEDTFSVKELVKEVSDELAPIAADADIAFDEELKEDHLFRGANRTLIFSMLFNVLNNAIKNSSEHQHIGIKTVLANGRFSVIVADCGRGMTPKELDLLFARFRKKLNPNQDSTGIGLAITKTIADFHDIVISVASEPGEGTRFTFLFPEK